MNWTLCACTRFDLEIQMSGPSSIPSLIYFLTDLWKHIPFRFIP
jgi:hypothetical protein